MPTKIPIIRITCCLVNLEIISSIDHIQEHSKADWERTLKGASPGLYMSHWKRLSYFLFTLLYFYFIYNRLAVKSTLFIKQEKMKEHKICWSKIKRKPHALNGRVSRNQQDKVLLCTRFTHCVWRCACRRFNRIKQWFIITLPDVEWCAWTLD